MIRSEISRKKFAKGVEQMLKTTLKKEYIKMFNQRCYIASDKITNMLYRLEIIEKGNTVTLADIIILMNNL